MPNTLTLSLPMNLRSDCERCQALCCVGPSFNAAQGFGFDKPAHSPCPNLNANFRCNIHCCLSSHGFSSCAKYECYGAGPWIVAELFKDVSWTDSSEAAAKIFTAFRRARALHELLAVLWLIKRGLRNVEQRHQLDALYIEIEQARSNATESVESLRRSVVEFSKQSLSTNLWVRRDP